MKTVLFACIHNAGRSLIAAALFNRLADGSVAHAISAGTEPAARVHPEVQAVMLELGIDLSGSKPQKLTEELTRVAILLVTMGCGEACPVVSGLQRDDWAIADPKSEPIEQVRQIRDEIAQRVRELLASRGWLRARG
jgi:arsenate reductase (thioredoxin)